MALIEQCRDLRDRIERHGALRRASKDAEGLRERASALEEVRSGLASAIERMRVLRRRGISTAGAPDTEVAAAALRDYGATLTDDAPETGKEFGRLKRSLDKVAKDLISVVERALEAIKKDLPSIEEAFLKQVEVIPLYKDRVDEIRQKRDALQAGIKSAELSPEDLAAFLDRREQLRKLADELNPDEFPRDVLEFFKGTRQMGGAPLEKLTEKVRSWLAERDLLKNVRVTVVR